MQPFVYQGFIMNKNKTFDFINEQISTNEVVLFMKGTADFPQCGFSAMVVGILQTLGLKFKDINVLENPDLRQGIKDFADWQVDSDMMHVAGKDALFMHCLPAHRGEEVSADVIDGKQSVVWDEAENRLHVQKALMEYLLLGNV